MDVNGLLLKAKVHASNVSESWKLLLDELKPIFPWLEMMWAVGDYKQLFVDWVQEHLGWRGEVVKPCVTFWETRNVSGAFRRDSNYFASLGRGTHVFLDWQAATIE